jgi:predicted negative regulator of RcsB-dependent stress response
MDAVPPSRSDEPRAQAPTPEELAARENDRFWTTVGLAVLLTTSSLVGWRYWQRLQDTQPAIGLEDVERAAKLEVHRRADQEASATIEAAMQRLAEPSKAQVDRDATAKSQPKP